MAGDAEILISPVAVLEPGAHSGYRANQAILIRGNRIAYVGPAGEAPLPGRADRRTLSGWDRLAIPGLINAHTHSPENLVKATSDKLPLEIWLPFMFGVSGRMNAREVYLASALGAVEMLRSGTTAVLDHLWLALPFDEVPGALDAAMLAYSDTGIRACVAPLFDDEDHVLRQAARMGHPDLLDTFYGSRHARRPPLDEQLAVFDAYFQRWHRTRDGRLTCALGPAGVQWCSERLLAGATALARRHGGGIHIHNCETRMQAELCRRRFGRPALVALRDLGVTGPDLSLPHSVWIDEEELDVIAETGSTVVHNPAANLKLGSGLMPLRGLLDRGVAVGLGSDGSASSDNQVLFDAIKLASLIHNCSDPDYHKWVSAREAVQMATEHGAAVLQRRGQLGVLAEGALADITLLDLSSPLLLPLADAYRHLAFCETGGSVATVIVHGQVVVDGGQVLTVNVADLLAEVREYWASRPPGATPAELQQTVDQFDRFYRDYMGLSA